jgi:lysyl-tRNA synthetase class 2
MTEIAHPDRLTKLAALRAAGHDPYPARGIEAEAIESLVAAAGSVEAPGARIGTPARVAGRLGALRDFGKLVFAPLSDRSGVLQLGLERARLGEWWPQRKWLDGGDLVGVAGVLGRTNKGELTLWAERVDLLAKAVAPPPEKWHGLVDKEERYRRRYVDLWAHAGVREVFVARSRMLSAIRRFLEERGFLEVETPTLHPIAGGAAARPFRTHHNALGMDLYLRIAPELYLKRLIVGGLERVFEVSRNFRNEGLSVRHNPEFTMLELYQAQADCSHMIEITEQMIAVAARTVTGGTRVQFRGREYELAPPLPRASYADLLRMHAGADLFDADSVRTSALAAKLPVPAGALSSAQHYALANALFEQMVEPHLDGPLFVVEHPVAISPLAKAKPEDPRVAERFELYVGGMELANAFSELNDPAEQQRRFEEQVASKDPEAPGEVDWDYVQALEYGMPPAGGMGIGIDRLAMLLTGQDSIRDVLLFPALRPRQGAPEAPQA